MPYPNEHAARINDPDKYDSFRRKNDEFGKGIDVIYGVKDKKVEIQAIRFDAKKFTVSEAKKWLKDHNYKPILFEPASGDKKKNEMENNMKFDNFSLHMVGFESSGKKKKMTMPLERAVFKDDKCTIEKVPVLLEGEWNGIDYSVEVIEEMVKEFNAREEKDKKLSLFTDHIDLVMTWAGSISNVTYSEKERGSFGDYEIVDSEIIKKLKSQAENGGGFWGISPTLKVLTDDNLKAKHAILENVAIVTKPAQGEGAMLSNQEDEMTKAEKERLEKEKAEKEQAAKLEKEKLEKEKLEKEKLEKEKLEKEKLEKQGEKEPTAEELVAALEKKIEAMKEKKKKKDPKKDGCDDDAEPEEEMSKLEEKVKSLERLLSDMKAKEAAPQAEEPAILFPSINSKFEPNSTGTYRKQVHKEGVFVDPRDKQSLFASTYEREKKWVENYNKKLKKVPVPITHSDNPAHNTGWVTGLSLEENGDLYAEFQFTEPEVEKLVKQGTISDCSIMVNLNYVDDKGVKHGEVIEHIALTNNPHIANLGAFQKVGCEKFDIRSNYVAFEEVPFRKGNEIDRGIISQIDNLAQSNKAMYEKIMSYEKKEIEAERVAFEKEVDQLVEAGKIPEGLKGKVIDLVGSCRVNKVAFEANGSSVNVAEKLMEIFKALPETIEFEDDHGFVVQQTPNTKRDYLTAEDYSRIDYSKEIKAGNIEFDVVNGGKAFWKNGRK